VKATEARRAAIREERKENSVPFDEFFALQKKKVETGDLIEPIKEMLRGSMELSPEWAGEFRGFWKLDDDFTVA